MDANDFNLMNGKIVSKTRQTRISFDLITTGTEQQRDQVVAKLMSEMKLQGFSFVNFMSNGKAVS